MKCFPSFVMFGWVLLSAGPVRAEAVAMYVVADQLSVRSCPAATCGRVSFILDGQKVTVEESQNGWARISQYYDASCQDGRSQFVDSGPAECSEANGIIDGQLAEWVSLKFLSKERPAEPPAPKSSLEAALQDSDNFKTNRDAFLAASQKLVDQGTCTEADFMEMGGWTKATGANSDRPVYFMYCGGMRIPNRIYLDASSGRVFR